MSPRSLEMKQQSQNNRHAHFSIHVSQVINKQFPILSIQFEFMHFLDIKGQLSLETAGLIGKYTSESRR